MTKLLFVAVVLVLLAIALAERPATWENFNEASCSSPIPGQKYGPCWKGEGAGYSGYYWHYTCDDEGLIYEAECGTDGCDNCYPGINWDEKVGVCINYQKEYYQYTCL